MLKHLNFQLKSIRYCTNGEQCKIRTRIFVGYPVDQILSDRETMQKVSARQYVQYHDVVPPGVDASVVQYHDVVPPPPGVDASVVIMEELEPLGVEVDVHYTGPMGPFSPIGKQPVQTGNTFGADFSLDEKGMMRTYSPPIPVEEKQNVKKRDRPDAEVDKFDAEELLKKQKQEEEAKQRDDQLLNQQLRAISLQLEEQKKQFEEQKKELEEQRKISQHLMRVIATKVLDTAMPGEEFSGPKTGHEVAAAAFSNNEFENV